MNYKSFTAYIERCKQIWQDFKQSYGDPEYKAFFKYSYPVLCCPSVQCNLDATDYYSIALGSPKLLIPDKAGISIIEDVRTLERLRKEVEKRRNKDKKFKKELDRVKKRVYEFNPKQLKFHECRLEVRFPSLKMNLIQQIKKSPFVDQELTGQGRASIRVVLRTD